MQKHGLSVGIERVQSKVFLHIKAQGKLTHDDYALMTPLLENALEGVDAPSIDALLDGRELDGWEPRAAWDDLKIGLKHGNAFEKVAIVGNKKWMELGAKVGSWFISGEIQVFHDVELAQQWLQA